MRPNIMRNTSISLATVLVAVPLLAMPLSAQNLPTLRDMERRFPNLAPRHIEMCDRNGDGVFTRGEQACVDSVNDAMRDRR